LDSIEKLNALLRMDESGEEIAALLNEFLIDERKSNILLIKLNEMRKETATLASGVKLTKSEQATRSIVLSEKKPLTAQEVAGRAGAEQRSLRYATHASAVLNSLVSKGILGKFKIGYHYYFTNPKEAVTEQLKRRGETPDYCAPDEIAKETGMPLGTVLDAINEILS